MSLKDWIKKELENPDDSVEKQLGIFYSFILLTVMIISTLILGPTTFPSIAWTTIGLLTGAYSGMNTLHAYNRYKHDHKINKNETNKETNKEDSKHSSSDDAFIDG